jgi:hypothetical protein
MAFLAGSPSCSAVAPGAGVAVVRSSGRVGGGRRRVRPGGGGPRPSARAGRGSCLRSSGPGRRSLRGRRRSRPPSKPKTKHSHANSPQTRRQRPTRPRSRSRRPARPRHRRRRHRPDQGAAAHPHRRPARQQPPRNPAHLPGRRARGLRTDKFSGASRTRTGDLLGAIQALSQLSYSPVRPRYDSGRDQQV